jgi:hypothetical protein
MRSSFQQKSPPLPSSIPKHLTQLQHLRTQPLPRRHCPLPPLTPKSLTVAQLHQPLQFLKTVPHLPALLPRPLHDPLRAHLKHVEIRRRPAQHGLGLYGLQVLLQDEDVQLHASAAGGVHRGDECRGEGDEGGVDEGGEADGDEGVLAGGEGCGEGVVEGEEVAVELQDGGVGFLGGVREEVGRGEGAGEHEDDADAGVEVEGQEGGEGEGAHGREGLVEGGGGGGGQWELRGGGCGGGLDFEEGPAAGWSLLGGGFGDDVAESGEPRGEPCHTCVEEAEGGDATAVGYYVCGLEGGSLVGGQEEFNFSVKDLGCVSAVAARQGLEYCSKLAGLGHGGGGFQP